MPPGDPRADHHHVVLVTAKPSRLLAEVTVVLLIHAVKLEHDAGVVAEDRRVLEQLLGQRAAKVPAPRLHLLRA